MVKEINELNEELPKWKHEIHFELVDDVYGHIITHAYVVKFNNEAIKTLCNCPTLDTVEVLYSLSPTGLCEFTRTKYKCGLIDL